MKKPNSLPAGIRGEASPRATIIDLEKRLKELEDRVKPLIQEAKKSGWMVD